MGLDHAKDQLGKHAQGDEVHTHPLQNGIGGHPTQAGQSRTERISAASSRYSSVIKNYGARMAPPFLSGQTDGREDKLRFG